MVEFLKGKNVGAGMRGAIWAEGKGCNRGQAIIHNPGSISASHRGAFITCQYWVTPPENQMPLS